MVSKRLYAALRGYEVPHLIPPVLAVPLALAIGIGGLASMIASARMRSYSGAGASGVFIAYAVGSIWSWIASTRRARGAGEGATNRPRY